MITLGNVSTETKSGKIGPLAEPVFPYQSRAL